jgi:ferredoxin-NADP reductase/Na+-translocating ferredoxin:NAD+ oxidoreductase RnfD subunit
MRPMFNLLDELLNSITMYRLVLYYLIALVGIALVLCLMGILPFNPIDLLFTTVLLTVVCWITNKIFAWTFGVPANVESVYISALILALIVTPVKPPQDVLFFVWVGIWAMASKYILAINGKHLFNPAAFAVALTAITLNQTASWWVGTAPMLPFVVIGGILIVRKIRRFDLVASFLVSTALISLVFSLVKGDNLLVVLQQTALYSPVFFFAAVILTEPLTAPHTNRLQIIYGAIVGLLFAPVFHIGAIYFTPEIAILLGNIFAYVVSPKAKLILELKQKIQIAPDVYDFIFTPNKKLSFAAGQYMEWTLGHPNPDSRGNRRYFTLASSPTENDLILGVKFYPQSSSFKTSMLTMDNRSEIVAAQLAGDFVLPANPEQKCVFIAGGIGITPFRSMIKYLLDTQQKRPIVVFYSNKSAADILYRDIFDQAQRQLGIKTVYALTGAGKIPAGWKGYVGHINRQMIRREVPDYMQSLFYLSGPNAMVTAFEDVLRQMGVSKDHIRKDYFPGFA